MCPIDSYICKSLCPKKGWNGSRCPLFFHSSWNSPHVRKTMSRNKFESGWWSEN